MRIGRYLVTPGGAAESCTLFCGRADLSEAGGIHGLASEGENIRVSVMPVAEAVALTHTERVANATTIIALQWLENRMLAGELPFAGS